MRGQTDICGCFPTGRHYPGIADRLAASTSTTPVRGLAPTIPADTVWAAASFAVIDFETTGLDASVDRVIEMGIAKFDDGSFSGSENWLTRDHR